MSFHFVLPSNTSPDVFPNNTACSYSTPIHNLISLGGSWEVALTSATFSTCINTFHNDVIALEERIDKEVRLSHVTLKPRNFQKMDDAISYINKCIGDKPLYLSLDRRNHAILKITRENMTVNFGNTLRDIFGFTKNIYSGIGEYKAKGEFSLTRCIDYLYIYSNISDYVRIGNIKAPLLGVVSFESGKECDKLKENRFNNPTYVSVIQNNISQIDIGIFDGGGELIPFSDGATTVLRLHFRYSLSNEDKTAS